MSLVQLPPTLPRSSPAPAEPGSLPPYVFALVMYFLPRDQLFGSCALVCRKWSELIQEEMAPELERVRAVWQKLNRAPSTVLLPRHLRLDVIKAFRFGDDWAVQDCGGSCHLLSKGYLGEGQLTQWTDSILLLQYQSSLTIIQPESQQTKRADFYQTNNTYLLIISSKCAYLYDQSLAVKIFVQNVKSARFAGHILAVGTEELTLDIYRIDTGEKIATIENVGRYTATPSGSVIYDKMTGSKTELFQAKVQDGALKERMLCPLEGENRLLWSDDRTVITGCTEQANRLSLSGRQALNMEVPKKWVRARSDPEDQITMVQGIPYSDVLIFTVQTLYGTTTFFRGRKFFTSKHIFPIINDSFVFFVNGETLVTWERATHTWFRPINLPLGNKMFTPDGQHLVIASKDCLTIYPLSAK